jgi:hypothetical protein
MTHREDWYDKIRTEKSQDEMIPEYYQSFRDVFNKRKLSPAEQVE